VSIISHPISNFPRPNAEPIEFSAVVPVYNEEANLPELHRRLTTAFSTIGRSYEVILVDDGSSDRSAELIANLCRQDSRLRAIHFSRNFGHQAAVAAGLQHASGKAVVVMDADLQDPPELVPQLLERWREGFEVVYAQRTQRTHEGVLKRLPAYLYYRALRGLATVDVPPDTGDFCLMDRRVVDLLNQMPERNRFVRGLRAWVGFRQTAVQFVRPARYAGNVKYTFRKSLGLAVNGIVSFSKIPLRIATYLGLVVSLASFGLAVWYVVQKLTGAEVVRGWASTVVIVLFLGGVQLLTLGIIGEYISRIYDEVKQRPIYVIRERVGFGDPSDSEDRKARAHGDVALSTR
jgi:dolichol-phosphate mannosyltransferase